MIGSWNGLNTVRVLTFSLQKNDYLPVMHIKFDLNNGGKFVVQLLSI